jgi:hypothetical protein
MIEGPNDVYICALCVDIAVKLVESERKAGTIPKRPELGPLPPEIHGATEH